MTSPQRTDGWLQDRLGKVGASSIADMMAKTKTGHGASRANLMARLIVERLTGKPTDTHMNAAMQHGVDTEPQARATYAWETDQDVVEVGWIQHPDITDSGASPDGLVGDDGLVELKAPQTATHLETLLTGKVDMKYQLQMAWQMECTGRQWADFVSFDPRMPEHLQMFRKRFHRDEPLIQSIKVELCKFLEEMHKKLDQLNKLEKAA